MGSGQGLEFKPPSCTFNYIYSLRCLTLDHRRRFIVNPRWGFEAKQWDKLYCLLSEVVSFEGKEDT